MNNHNTVKDKKEIIAIYVIIAVICETVSLFIIGPRSDFAIGLIAGTVTMIINYNILGKVIDIMLSGSNITIAFLLQMGRYLLFGGVAFIVVKISTYAVIAYAIGILILSLVFLVKYGKGGCG
ncbi:MAG: hypothetical protein RR313_07105 [Anaerovoracaceae bacterium]